ncbi:MAG: FHA domain-containing protein, partial [Planctomycetes bacterium]|nr:FHA domain-containing protein [Planctomycetota bacterium]
KTGIDALHLKRVNNLTEEEYLVVYRQAIIGSSNRATIHLAGDSVEKRHARLHCLDDGFWIENLGAPGSMTVDQQAMQTRELAPLSPGVEFSLGEETIVVKPLEQLHL